MIYETIIRDKLQEALRAMSRADKCAPAVQFMKGIECAHSLGFHIVIYATDTEHLGVSFGRNAHRFSNEEKKHAEPHNSG